MDNACPIVAGYRSSNESVLIELPDGKLDDPEGGGTYDSLDKAKTSLLTWAQHKWDGKHREEATDAAPAA
jgi:hypothetical protein